MSHVPTQDRTKQWGMLAAFFVVFIVVLAAVLGSTTSPNADSKPEVVTGIAVTVSGVVTQPTSGTYHITDSATQTSRTLLNGNDPILQNALEPVLNTTVTMYGYQPVADTRDIFVLWVNGVDLTKLPRAGQITADERFEAILKAYTPQQQACITETVGTERVTELLAQASVMLTIDDLKTFDGCVTKHPAAVPTGGVDGQ